MIIYVLDSVKQKEQEYVDFLLRNCGYNNIEAQIKYWEIEYKVNQRCNPILMKPNSSGTLKFKSVLQRQEIKRFANNRSQLMNIIKRRRGARGNTQWFVDYVVSSNGDVFITSIKCYNTFSEDLDNQEFQQIINDCVQRCLVKYLNENTILLKGRSHLLRL